MLRSIRAKCAVCFAASATLLAIGCSTSTCDRDADSLTVSHEQGISGDKVWLSSPYHDPALALEGAPYWHFPPARTITFEHHLGSLPVPHDIELAFTGYGALAPGSGNEDIILCMDDNVIQIKNDTCSDFYVFVATSASGIHSASIRDCVGNPNPYFDATGGSGSSGSTAEGGSAGTLSDAAGAGGS